MESLIPERLGSSDVAIVGIALRFPGAHGPDAFWSNLRTGVESVRSFGDAELAARGVPARLLRDPAYVKAGFVLDGMDLFDAEFFGFSPKDASILDPQHRQFLECAWEALEDSGHAPESFLGPIGVFAGCGMSSYLTFHLLANPALVESVGLFLLRHTGNDKDFLTTRTSYCLDLKGPSINVQTACSTSLVAVHLACQSLNSGECDMALAGGVTVEIPHGHGYLYRAGEILSPDAHCRPFEQRAQGTVFGSGVGIVVLRRLADALRDGDRIYAVVKGSAVNNDGASKVGYLAPSVDGQAAVVAEALAVAGVDAAAISYVEAHGSGTPLGEPIEVAALVQAFARSSARVHGCGLGSVKANIGHLDTAAGVAGLIKVALALHHGELPPMPGFETPHASLPLRDSPFYVVDRLQPWARGAQPRRAGVTALGVGGTNAHVVVEEAPLPSLHAPSAGAARRAAQLVCVSARTEQALDDASARLAGHLRAHPEQELADVAFTLLTGRRAFAQRRVVCCRDGEDAAALLASKDPQRVHTHVASSAPAPIAFLLPGGGSQHARMGCGLYESEPVFRAEVDRGIDELRRRTQRDLRSAWLAPADPERAARELERPALQLPAIFILEHALAKLWASAGVHPTALLGHSLGEYTAACLSGVFTFEDALGLIALRGELFETLPQGGLLGVPLSPQELVPYLGRDLDLAAVNAPRSAVVSGPVAALDDLARRLVQAGVDARRVPISVAAHSRVVDPILPRFVEHLRTLRFAPPRIPFLSNLTGTWITPEQAQRPEYWAEHLRGTVRFADGVRELLADKTRVLLEVGPGKGLSSLVRQQGDAGAQRGAIATLRHTDEETPDSAHFLGAFGRLWARGAALDARFPWRDEPRARVSLPTYPFQRRRHWVELPQSVEPRVTAATEPRRLPLLSTGLQRPVWRPAACPPGSAADRSGPWLLFLDAAGLGEALATRLRARGDSVICVRESDDNRRLGEHEFALAPERGREGYDALVRDLVAGGVVPRRIVHAWLLTPDERARPGSNFFHRNQERGFYSLLFLAQALNDEGVRGPLHISVLGNGMQALDGERLLHPSKATVFGPSLVIPRELPGFTCSSVDLPLAVSSARDPARAVNSARAAALLELVEPELACPPCNAQVAYRGRQRHELAYEAVALAPTGDGARAPLRERGVYLITGGLGALGLELASHLARSVRARLVLVGRSPLPARAAWPAWLREHAGDDVDSRRIRAVEQLESDGAEVLVACADVSDIDALGAVFAQARARFGALHGVVHAAGVLRDAPLLAKTQREAEEVFAPKIHGTLVLDALLRDVELDFLALYSSVSGIVAPPGQVDYVAASAFLDAYAQSVDRRDQRRTVSIDWGVWREAGLAAQASHADVRRAAAAPAARAPRRTPRLAPQRARDGAAAGPFVLETRYSPQTHWLLDEHRTRDGIAVLPGTAYLEMARAALIEIGAAPVFELCDLALLRPLIVADGEARDVRVELQPEPGGFAFRVLSRSDARELHAGLDASAAPAEWIVHAQAAVRVDAPRAAADAPLREIEARCATHRIADGAPALAAIQAGRMRFGSRWQALREVRLGPGEALATLELPPGLVGDLDQYGLHPALLDIATTCGLELAELHAAAGPDRPAVGGAAGAGLWVPLSYRSVRVHAPLGASVRSWLRGSRSNRAGADILSFDVTLTDAQGRSCVEIDDFALRRTRGALAMAAAAPSARPRAARADSERAADESERASARPASPALAALRRNLEQGIRPAEGVEALVRILAGPQHAQIVATTLDLDGLRAQAQALGAPADAAAGATDAAATRAADGGGFVDASDGIEHVLAGFWKELLGVASVGVRDNFFDLGGHSLIAVRLFARIKRAFQVDFPISLLFEAPTIERCAAAIRAAQGSARAPEEARARPEQARFTHLVPMHSGRGGDGTPLFVVAGMFGNVLNLRHLVNLLGDDRPCFGLQALGLYGAQSPHETFEQMAGDYLVEMRRVQPHGPYLLSGFSGGGITAFEIARQLLASGEEVALLALLDTAVPEPPQLRASERARIHWQRMLRRGPAYLAEWAREKLDYQRARARQRRADAHPVAMPSEFRSDEIGRAFRRALGRYRVRGYPGVLTLFRPPLEIAHVLGPRRRANAKRELVFPDNGWGAYARRVDVHEVPGDHDSMVLEPNVRVLAAKLRHCIAAVEPRTRNGVAR